MEILLESFSSALAAKPQSERARATQEAVNALPNDQKNLMAEALGLHPPSPSTSNKVWLVVIYAFAFSMVVSVVVLGVGVFVSSTNGVAKPDTILTIFTTTTAFIAGLFSPSPVSKSTGT